jgi:solute:Na+ symporter, SSS family
MDLITIVSFVFFTALVGFLTWLLTRGEDVETNTGFFLAGRSLTFPVIAGSLLLTNLSAEQLVGLNGDAFANGFCVMVWEVVAVIALVFMAWFFLPRFLKSGVATVPEYLEIRFDRGTQVITNLIFLIAYAVILLPIILYTGATGMVGIMGMPTFLGEGLPSLGLSGYQLYLWIMVWGVGLIGAVYALFGGMKSVAVSDTLNGIGLLTGGFLLTYFALSYLGGEKGFSHGWTLLFEQQKERFNSIGSPKSSAPFTTIFMGIFLLNLFYWTTNQQIIQRTFAAKGLAEGQKGVLLCGALKLLGPLYLVIPGMIAFSIFQGQEVASTQAYGKLVNLVLPKYLTGFFAAVVVGAILSSFNSALNSCCTLFSLGIYKGMINPNATDKQVVRSSVIFGWIIAFASMSMAPFLDSQPNIFSYLQKMNGMYFIPIFAVVLVGMLNRRVPPIAAKIGLVAGFAVIAVGYFVKPFDQIVASMHEFNFLGVVFAWLVILMLIIGELRPMKEEFVQQDVKAVDMTPWKLAIPVGIILILTVIAIYYQFADFSVLTKFGGE